MKNGFLSVGVSSPRVTVADCYQNAAEILSVVKEAAQKGVKILCFPQLSLTGYTCGDLFLQSALLQGAEDALFALAQQTKGFDLLFAVGLPLRAGDKLYNTAALLCQGEILGFVPKTYLCDSGVSCESRYFASAPKEMQTVSLRGKDYPFGTTQLFVCASLPECRIAVELGDELLCPVSPCVSHANAGATVVLNLGATPDLVGAAQYYRNAIAVQSAKSICAYLYAEAGFGESTTDMVFAGNDVIAQNGAILAQSAPFTHDLSVTEIDVQMLASERRRLQRTNASCAYAVTPFDLSVAETKFSAPLWHLPFIPKDKEEQARRFAQILTVQAKGLEKRMAHAHCKTPVLGISGGLDSCLALLVTVRATDALGLPRSSVLTVTLPCFGTTKRTKTNAQLLCEELGVSFQTIDISDAVRQHLHDIGRDESIRDVTYENAQARTRTLVLMDLANRENGMVIGTGDLSELALGWATYNGDHMSMYGVNASIPKTLVRYLVRYCAEEAQSEGLRRVLWDILDTPVSPELLPADGDKIAQCTEDIVGPYELHDFFLYYMIRYGFAPQKIFRLACHAFYGTYEPQIILKWLSTFTRRFFIQQFKRSCLPDGVKVGSVSLSPRGDFRMPSDALSSVWMEEIEALQKEFS